ncbi:MAG: hypothetical protein R2771_07665 [Saprospiraceae bacterium]
MKVTKPGMTQAEMREQLGHEDSLNLVLKDIGLMISEDGDGYLILQN